MDACSNIIDDDDRLVAIRELEAYRKSVRQTVRQDEKTINDQILKDSNTNEFSN
jgi:hypothetical protein